MKPIATMISEKSDTNKDKKDINKKKGMKKTWRRPKGIQSKRQTLISL